jgi:hypothetical protein
MPLLRFGAEKPVLCWTLDRQHQAREELLRPLRSLAPSLVWLNLVRPQMLSPTEADTPSTQTLTSFWIALNGLRGIPRLGHAFLQPRGQ